MALPPTSHADRGAIEQQLLDSLLGLYTRQQGLYDEVLELSMRQRDMVRDGKPLTAVRTVLESKKQHLETIRRLDLDAQNTKDHWRRERRTWSAVSRTRLHQALDSLGQTIEDILACEEENDLELLQQAR